uniref:C3H1-type domain-containing protein n=1 Tax=Photinus pyralis TaxID=7054 RepID=A0A1Y1KC97_PHOPY
MLIDDADAFKTWLTAVLKPICEADPGALAKYVFALVKKDKSPEALRQSMISQLEVFLQHETEPFVNLLFKTLESRDYLTPVIPSTNPPNPNIIKPPEVTPLSPKSKELKKEIIPVSELPNLSESVNGNAIVKKEEVKRDARKSESEKEDKPRKRSRHRSLSRNRSRSRSWDRNRRSRSREKSREPYREKRTDRPRPYRNKSPPRRYDRRRSRSPTPTGTGRARSRSRSPRHNYRGRYRNRSPPRSNSRSRSRSADRKDRAGTPTQDSNHGDLDLRLTNSTQSIQSVIHNSTGNRSPKKRCRDYDEKGFCMRGEMCPYDHGVDPVVLEDTALTRVLTFGPNGAPLNEPPPPMIPPPIIGGAGHPNMHHIPPRPLMPEYNPQAPHMWPRGGFRGPRAMLGPRLPHMGPFMPQSGLQRELISVPVMDNQQPEFGNNFSRHQYMPPDIEQQEGIFKKKQFDYNRLGPRAKNPSNCSLELKKVPTGLNNIAHLNNHFSKFGKIVNIQVFYEGDPEAAIVTFSSHAEANAAYRSTEAVLNNRFIKVFWHPTNGDGKQENVPPRSVKDRLGVPNTVPPNSNKVLNLVQPKADNATDEPVTDKAQPHNNFTKNNLPVLNKEETKVQAAAAIKKGQELLAAKEKLKKNQEEKRKEALKITQDLRKRKQELLEKQLAQQKLLIDKVEKTPAGPQRDLLLQTIKKSQEATEAIRKDMLSQPLPAVKLPQRKSKEEVQKEVLDAELDLITKAAEGADTSELQKKVIELKAKISLGARRASRGRRFNPIGRHLLTKNNLIDSAKSPTGTRKQLAFPKHAVDHRTTKILVSGYEGDEQESVLAQFTGFGEIVDYVSDPVTPSIVFNYKTRKDAETALLKGKNFQDRTLSITWCNNSQLNNQLSGRTSTRTVLVSESDEDHLIDSNLIEFDGSELDPGLSEEALLHDDEEEDEDNEGRSWRR